MQAIPRSNPDVSLAYPGSSGARTRVTPALRSACAVLVAIASPLPVVAPNLPPTAETTGAAGGGDAQVLLGDFDLRQGARAGGER